MNTDTGELYQQKMAKAVDEADQYGKVWVNEDGERTKISLSTDATGSNYVSITKEEYEALRWIDQSKRVEEWQRMREEGYTEKAKKEAREMQGWSKAPSQIAREREREAASKQAKSENQKRKKARKQGRKQARKNRRKR